MVAEGLAKGLRRRRPEEKMCGACPFVGTVVFVLNKLLSQVVSLLVSSNKTDLSKKGGHT